MRPEIKPTFRKILFSKSSLEQNIVYTVCNDIFNCEDIKHKSKKLSISYFYYHDNCYGEGREIVSISQIFRRMCLDHAQEELWGNYLIFEVIIRYKKNDNRIEFLEFDIPLRKKLQINDEEILKKFYHRDSQKNFRLQQALKNKSATLSIPPIYFFPFLKENVAGLLFSGFIQLRSLSQIFYQRMKQKNEFIEMIHIKLLTFSYKRLMNIIKKASIFVCGLIEFSLIVIDDIFYFKVFWPMSYRIISMVPLKLLEHFVHKQIGAITLNCIYGSNKLRSMTLIQKHPIKNIWFIKFWCIFVTYYFMKIGIGVASNDDSKPDNFMFREYYPLQKIAGLLNQRGIKLDIVIPDYSFYENYFNKSNRWNVLLESINEKDGSVSAKLG